jgi:YHS domain-containing protein
MEVRMVTKLHKRDARPMDPQCGKLVELEKAVQLTWEGATYYFCSEECRRRFEEDPPGVAGF